MSVTFDYAAWSARYASLAAVVTADQAQACFDEAGLYLANSDAGPVPDPVRRALLLNMLTAHLAQLALPQDQGGAGGMVGRVTRAARGSVSISTDYGRVQERAAWFNQTPYGAAFWMATRNLRQARYVPGGAQKTNIWP